MNSRELAEKIAHLTLDKKASEVLILNLVSLTSITDYFVICTGSSNTQVKAISEHVSDELKKKKIRPLHVEGTSNEEWVLMDYVDVVVHIFQPQKREFYGLERLWGDAEIMEINDEQ